MKVNFVGLGLNNPRWTTQMSKFINNHFDYINIQKCSEQGLTKLYEDECHVTLAYGLETKPGPNSIYCQLRVVWADLYNELRNKILTLDDCTIDTFVNDDFIVLKLNIENCNLITTLREYNKRLVDLYGNNSGHIEYHPHITISYLNKDISEDALNKIINSFDKRLLSEFEISNFMISNEDASESRIYQIK